MRNIITWFKFFTSFSLTLVIWLNSHCQEISKISEIYDYEIGDVFHIYSWADAGGMSGFGAHSNREILNKFYSPSFDTVFYVSEVTSVYIDMTGTTYYNFIDTISYTNLNSLINNGNIDSVYSDSELYNGRKINYYEWSGMYEGEEGKYIVGCGGPYIFYYYYDPPFEDLENGIELIYYLKGDEEWGEPYFVNIHESGSKIPLILIFPNPAKKYITLSLTDVLNKKVEIFIYSPLGILEQHIRTDLSQNDNIDISDLANGLHVIKIENGNQVLIDKFIKE
jgi:hypothetical protein